MIEYLQTEILLGVLIFLEWNTKGEYMESLHGRYMFMLGRCLSLIENGKTFHKEWKTWANMKYGPQNGDKFPCKSIGHHAPSKKQA